ncbi:MAG TPA: PC4/YdbC family ssDNA-binding protein [Candidatus Methanomethylophilaceae archaeon]|nr:PC4/YdbC family ssDNA-binding protein [Candidatus Methanomethylophilaceae archaeon]
MFILELKNMTTEFKYDIVEEIAVLSESSKGWTKQLNIISWNGKDPKYDVREWAPDRSKMGKGVTLSLEEATILKMALDTREDLE